MLRYGAVWARLAAVYQHPQLNQFTVSTEAGPSVPLTLTGNKLQFPFARLMERECFSGRVMQATQIKSLGSFTKQTHTHTRARAQAHTNTRLQNTEDLILAGSVMILSAHNRRFMFFLCGIIFVAGRVVSFVQSMK